jgi:hypothetical protein
MARMSDLRVPVSPASAAVPIGITVLVRVIHIPLPSGVAAAEVIFIESLKPG